MVDRRTFKDRRDLWQAEKEKPKLELVKPKAKLRDLELGVNDDKKRKPRKQAEGTNITEAATVEEEEEE